MGTPAVMFDEREDYSDIGTLDAEDVRDTLTEAGAAERFARLHGGQVRYDHHQQRWLLWDLHRWQPDANAGVIRLTLLFARAWQRDALDYQDRTRRHEAVKFAMRLERRDGLTNLLALARALRPIADSGRDWDVDRWLLGVPNGVVDLRTGMIRHGDPTDRITMNTAVDYQPAAACPRWERFIAEVFNNDIDLIAFMHRAIGYSLCGDTSEQCLFLLYGTGSNGKGTLTNTLKRILGDYAWNMPFATIEMRDRCAIPNDLAALVNRRFVTASETNDGTRLNELRVKTLTGCDPLTARFLHGEFFTFEPIAKFWLSVNHKPIVRDDSFGFWRRLRLIPFMKAFPVNATLAAELDSEAEGILAWAIRGCLAWQQQGLDPPAVVRQATAEYETDSDPLGGFLEEACERDTASEVHAKELYEDYRRWADAHNLGDRERLTATMFGRKMGERFEKLRDRTEGVIYCGIARRSTTL
jgi:putative DNA primase/helicase